MADLCRPLRAAAAAEGEGEKPGTAGKDSKPGNPLPPGGWSAPVKPGWKLELKADANPGKTGAEEGTPTAAACSGATDATEEGAAPDSPINEDSTAPPLALPPDTGSLGNVVGLGPGERPGNIEAAELSPRANGEAAVGAGLAKPW